MVPDLIRPHRAVEQQDCALGRLLEHVVAFEEAELVHADEVGLADQVGRLDGMRPKAQVRDGARAGLLRVVDEIALRVVVSFFADDLDRVLVGADGAVGAQAPEHAAHGVFGFDVEVRVVVEAGVRHIVVDADGEVVLRLRLAPAHRRRLAPSPA